MEKAKAARRDALIKALASIKVCAAAGVARPTAVR